MSLANGRFLVDQAPTAQDPVELFRQGRLEPASPDFDDFPISVTASHTAACFVKGPADALSKWSPKHAKDDDLKVEPPLFSVRPQPPPDSSEHAAAIQVKAALQAQTAEPGDARVHPQPPHGDMSTGNAFARNERFQSLVGDISTGSSALEALAAPLCIFLMAMVATIPAVTMMWSIDLVSSEDAKMGALVAITSAVAFCNVAASSVVHKRFGAIVWVPSSNVSYVHAWALFLVLLAVATAYELLNQVSDFGALARDAVSLGNGCTCLGVAFIAVPGGRRRGCLCRVAFAVAAGAAAVALSWLPLGLLLDPASAMEDMPHFPFLCGLLVCCSLINLAPALHAARDRGESPAAALFAACCSCCPRLGGVEKREVGAVAAFGEPMAFQQELLCERHAVVQYVCSCMTAFILALFSVATDPDTALAFFMVWTVCTRAVHAALFWGAAQRVKLSHGQGSRLAVYRARRHMAILLSRLLCEMAAESTIVSAVVVGSAMQDDGRSGCGFGSFTGRQALVCLAAKLALSYTLDSAMLVALSSANVNTVQQFWRVHFKLPVVALLASLAAANTCIVALSCERP